MRVWKLSGSANDFMSMAEPEPEVFMQWAKAKES